MLITLSLLLLLKGGNLKGVIIINYYSLFI